MASFCDPAIDAPPRTGDDALHIGAGRAPIASDADTSCARIDLLDGWRALSILCVLAGHWLPLGPARWHLNAGTAAAGMALFFTLSGFLIVRVLLVDDRVAHFLIRRCFRIVPLAWAAVLVLIVATHAPTETAAANLLFAANLPPDHLMHGGSHLWSLCVEVQFYAAVALLVAIGGRRGLLLLPIGAVAITLARIAADQPISIVTWHRVDEILAGATLALVVYRTRLGLRLTRWPRWTCVLLLPLLVAAGRPEAGALAYLRPYLAAAAIGVSIFSAPEWLRVIWCSRPSRYVASVSYAVYVIHGMLGDTWLGGGQGLVKYSRRPLLVAATFALAHLSTFRFEAPMIALGKRLSRRLGGSPAQTVDHG